jgi:hypothetical protein
MIALERSAKLGNFNVCPNHVLRRIVGRNDATGRLGELVPSAPALHTDIKNNGVDPSRLT